MHRARVYLAIVVYHIFVKRFINKSLTFVFYPNVGSREPSIDNYKQKSHIYKFNRLDHFFIHNDSCNLGLTAGFLSQFLII